jgi:hypothetical protein
MNTKIRDVLLREWDPLQIGGNSNLTDEYDAYISSLVGKLRHNPNVIELKSCLEQIEKEMGVETSEETRRKTAEELIAAFGKMDE